MSDELRIIRQSLERVRSEVEIPSHANLTKRLYRARRNIDHAIAAIDRIEAQPIADERDELREALERLYNSIDSCVDLTPELMLRTRAILAKYP